MFGSFGICAKLPCILSVKLIKLPPILTLYGLKMPCILSRSILQDLLAWAKRENRKQLILRGARQVGKSTTAQMLADALNL